MTVSNPTDILKNGLRATQASYSTASVDWSTYAGKLIVALVFGFNDTAARPAAPTLSGGSVTWTFVSATPTDSAFNKRTFIFVGHAASGSTGAITIDWGADSMQEAAWLFMSFDGADVTDNGADALSQVRWGVNKSGSASNGAQLFGNPLTDTSNNACLILGSRPGDPDTTYDDYTEVQEFQLDASAPIMFSAWRSGGATLNPSLGWTNDTDFYLAWCEIRAAGTRTSGFTDGDPVLGLTGGSTTNAANYSLGTAWTPAADALVLYAILSTQSGGSAGPSSVSAHGITFTQVDEVALGDYTLSVWRGSSASPTSTTVSIQHGGVTQSGCAAIGLEFTEVQNVVPVQAAENTASADTVTVTLGAGAASENGVIGFFAFNVNLNTVLFPWGTPDEGSTFLPYSAAGDPGKTGYNTPSSGLTALWRREFNTTMALTASGAGTALGLALELDGPAGSPAQAGAPPLQPRDPWSRVLTQR